MEALVQEKILGSFVNELSVESVIISPIVVDMKEMNINKMLSFKTLTTKDNNYFIRYETGLDAKIEVYSVDSIQESKSIIIFNNIRIGNHAFSLDHLEQDIDGNFYGIGRYYNGSSYERYLVIFNNFVQDGYLKIKKYYTNSSMNIPSSSQDWVFVKKINELGIYYILQKSTDGRTYSLIRFKIDILEGNQTSIASVTNTLPLGRFARPQLSVFKDKLIFTEFYALRDLDQDDYDIEYLVGYIDFSQDLPSTITLNSKRRRRKVKYHGFWQ